MKAVISRFINSMMQSVFDYMKNEQKNNVVAEDIPKKKLRIRFT